jgi:capsular polysaccharide biosynthesis protein
MIDATLMLDLRNSILDLARNRNSQYNRIYIYRPQTSLRKLINKKGVMKVLVDSGFMIVHPEKMTLFERIEVFSNARIVITESGAGTANLYFCSANTKIVELKHPQMIRSREYEAIEVVTGNEFQIVHGRSPNFWEKVRFGRDSFSISTNDLSILLKEMPDEYGAYNEK